MKKASIFILLLLIATMTYAQKFSIGFRDSKSWTNIRYTDTESSVWLLFKSRKDGRNSGLILNYRLTNHLSANAELIYQEKGFKISTIPLTTGDNGIYYMDYISAPFSVRYEIGNKIKYYGYGGLYFSYLNTATNDLSLSLSDPSRPSSIDNSYNPYSDFNKNEMGFIVGAGIAFPLCEKVAFFVDSRIESGLTRAVKKDLEIEPYRYTSLIKDVYNKSFLVSWGILYTIPGKEK